MGKFSPSMTIVSGDQVVSSKTPDAAGAGITAATTPTLVVSKSNYEYITTILVDLTGLECSGDANDVIGDDDAEASYFTKLTAAVNGYVTLCSMHCVELPAGTNVTTHVDLRMSTAPLAEDADATGGANDVQIIDSDGAWELGGMVDSETIPTGADAVGTRDYYVYLTTGDSAQSGGTYTAGKFVIQLYGYNF